MRRLYPYQMASFGLALVVMVISLVLVDRMKRLIDALPAGMNASVWGPLVGFGLGYVVMALVFEFVFRRTQIVGRNEILVVLFTRMQDKPLAYVRKQDSGHIMSLINNEGREVGDWLSFGMLALFQLCSLLVLSVGLMAYYSPVLAAIACVAVLLVYASSTFLASKIAKLTAKSFEVTSRINRLLLQTLKAETIIHMLNAHDWFVGRFTRLVYRERYPLDRQRMNIHAVYTTIYLFLTLLLPILVVVIGAMLSDSLNLSVGSLLAFYALTAQLQEPLQVIPELLAQRKTAIGLADHLVDILDNTPTTPDTAATDTDRLPDIPGELTVDIDHFSYDADSPRLLEGFHLASHPGDLIILKGASGAGKTTLLNLITGFVKSDTASISLNGHDLTQARDTDRWRHILLAEQEPLLIDGTLMDNICFGQPYPTEAIRDILHVTCLDGFTDTDGLDTIIQGDNDAISGGQKQRVALARMLIRHPDILILDEPTAALDPHTSAQLAHRLVDYAEAHAITLIVVTHKPDFDPWATTTFTITSQQTTTVPQP
jgi:ABC-type bacteriocin/lantibiotic exporter with double-glycine peptidase domain